MSVANITSNVVHFQSPMKKICLALMKNEVSDGNRKSAWTNPVYSSKHGKVDVKVVVMVMTTMMFPTVLTARKPYTWHPPITLLSLVLVYWTLSPPGRSFWASTIWDKTNYNIVMCLVFYQFWCLYIFFKSFFKLTRETNTVSEWNKNKTSSD